MVVSFPVRSSVNSLPVGSASGGGSACPLPTAIPTVQRPLPASVDWPIPPDRPVGLSVPTAAERVRSRSGRDSRPTVTCTGRPVHTVPACQRPLLGSIETEPVDTIGHPERIPKRNPYESIRPIPTGPVTRCPARGYDAEKIVVSCPVPSVPSVPSRPFRSIGPVTRCPAITCHPSIPLERLSVCPATSYADRARNTDQSFA